MLTKKIWQSVLKCLAQEGALEITKVLLLLGQMSKLRHRQERTVSHPGHLPSWWQSQRTFVARLSIGTSPRCLHFDYYPVNLNDSIAPALNRFSWLKKKKNYKIRLTFHDSLFQNVLYQCIMYKANVWLVAGPRPRSRRRRALGKPWYRRISCRVSFSKLLFIRFMFKRKKK